MVFFGPMGVPRVPSRVPCGTTVGGSRRFILYLHIRVVLNLHLHICVAGANSNWRSRRHAQCTISRGMRPSSVAASDNATTGRARCLRKPQSKSKSGALASPELRRACPCGKILRIWRKLGNQSSGPVRGGAIGYYCVKYLDHSQRWSSPVGMLRDLQLSGFGKIGSIMYAGSAHF